MLIPRSAVEGVVASEGLDEVVERRHRDASEAADLDARDLAVTEQLVQLAPADAEDLGGFVDVEQQLGHGCLLHGLVVGNWVWVSGRAMRSHGGVHHGVSRSQAGGWGPRMTR